MAKISLSFSGDRLRGLTNVGPSSGTGLAGRRALRGDALPPARARALLAEQRLHVRSEEDVYRAAVAWLRAQDPPADAAMAAEILSLVRYR